MPYLVKARYKAGNDDLRDAHIAAHVAYLDASIGLILAAGGLVSDDNRRSDGLLYILATEERAEAEAFIANDPFSKVGLIGSVEIARWRKSYFDGRRLLGDPLATSAQRIRTEGPPS